MIDYDRGHVYRAADLAANLDVDDLASRPDVVASLLNSGAGAASSAGGSPAAALGYRFLPEDLLLADISGVWRSNAVIYANLEALQAELATAALAAEDPRCVAP